ncbi:methyltransferase domain-containing protein [Hymenobacter lapidiphilus]|uniref:methyltransferase domain-containing protein n=1 Tax=Hymenobacter sp. CCM 8763 TaxID=2303334 RepID=UPI001F5B28DE|nr:methyltransferase domain-containing protein [Hymenobacter sp. CCM 8763]
MADLRTRSEQDELMDDLTLASDELRQNLDELETVNTWLGGYAPVLDALARLRPRFPAGAPARGRFGQRRRRHAPPDCPLGPPPPGARRAGWHRCHAFMLDYAAAKAQAYPEISFQQADIFAPDFARQPFDILTASLFCHHFSDEQLVQMLAQWHRQAGLAVIINDLHRHPLAYHSIRWLTRLLGGSRLVRHDAPLSVARAFTRPELEALLAAAGIRNYTLRWRWAFRWQLVISA